MVAACSELSVNWTSLVQAITASAVSPELWMAASMQVSVLDAITGSASFGASFALNASAAYISLPYLTAGRSYYVRAAITVPCALSASNATLPVQLTANSPAFQAQDPGLQVSALPQNGACSNVPVLVTMSSCSYTYLSFYVTLYGRVAGSPAYTALSPVTLWTPSSALELSVSRTTLQSLGLSGGSGTVQLYAFANYSSAINATSPVVSVSVAPVSAGSGLTWLWPSSPVTVTSCTVNDILPSFELSPGCGARFTLFLVSGSIVLEELATERSLSSLTVNPATGQVQATASLGSLLAELASYGYANTQLRVNVYDEPANATAELKLLYSSVSPTITAASPTVLVTVLSAPSGVVSSSSAQQLSVLLQTVPYATLTFTVTPSVLTFSVTADGGGLVAASFSTAALQTLLNYTLTASATISGSCGGSAGNAITVSTFSLLSAALLLPSYDQLQPLSFTFVSYPHPWRLGLCNLASNSSQALAGLTELDPSTAIVTWSQSRWSTCLLNLSLVQVAADGVTVLGTSTLVAVTDVQLLQLNRVVDSQFSVTLPQFFNLLRPDAAYHAFSLQSTCDPTSAARTPLMALPSYVSLVHASADVVSGFVPLSSPLVGQPLLLRVDSPSILTPIVLSQPLVVTFRQLPNSALAVASSSVHSTVVTRSSSCVNVSATVLNPALLALPVAYPLEDDVVALDVVDGTDTSAILVQAVVVAAVNYQGDIYGSATIPASVWPTVPVSPSGMVRIVVRSLLYPWLTAQSVAVPLYKNSTTAAGQAVQPAAPLHDGVRRTDHIHHLTRALRRRHPLVRSQHHSVLDHTRQHSGGLHSLTHPQRQRRVFQQRLTSHHLHELLFQCQRPPIHGPRLRSIHNPPYPALSSTATPTPSLCLHNWPLATRCTPIS